MTHLKPQPSEPTSHDSRPGAAVYSSAVLSFYDLLVIHFSNTYVWRCPSQMMLDQYTENIGARHLEVGTGTGWFLTHTDLPSCIDLTLLDLNKNSLRTAARRVRASQQVDPSQITLVEADALKPLSGLRDENAQFDSIAVNYVLHCLPGSPEFKDAIFANLAPHLAPGGTFFGATILGSGVPHSTLGTAFMRFYNRQTIFHNEADNATTLKAQLCQHFDDVSVRIVGSVALFRASRCMVRGHGTAH